MELDFIIYKTTLNMMEIVHLNKSDVYMNNCVYVQNRIVPN